MQLIQTITLDSSASSITFDPIPQDYDDLVIKVSARSDFTTDEDYIDLVLNGNTANQSYIVLRGTGSGVGSFTLSRNYISSNFNTANTFGSVNFYISNYTSSSAKSISSEAVAENNGTSSNQAIQASLWNDTSAITGIGVQSATGNNLLAGSTFSLYGVTAGGDGTVTTA